VKRSPAYIVVLTLVVGFSLASCGKKERVIPKEKMSEIYAEMYVLDQWLDDNRSLRREADTSLVYAPVLEKYGYTYDDYLNSVDVYMRDPARYSRILRRTSEILNGRLTDLKAEKNAREEALRESRRLDSLRNLVRLNVDSLMRCMIRSTPSDSLVVGLDSLGFMDFRFVRTCDTTYDGPAMLVIRDTLAAASDSLSIAPDSFGVAAPPDSSKETPRSDTIKTGGKEKSGMSRKTDVEPVKAELNQSRELKLIEEQPAAGKARMRKFLPSRDTSARLR